MVTPGSSIDVSAVSDNGNMLFIAQYNADGVLIKVDTAAVTDGTVQKTAEIGEINAGKVKIFLWNDTNTPCCNAVELSGAV